MWYLIILVALLMICIVLVIATRHVVILEYEKGLKYIRGHFREVLGPGSYWIPNLDVKITKIDMRSKFMFILGQEVISSDGVSIKISLAADYRMVDPVKAMHTVEDYCKALYTYLQLALRDLVTTTEVENIMNGRNELSARLLETCAPKATELGLSLISVDFKDVMFPGRLKETFSQVVAARKEGEAALEKARGETAALRNLANAARMMESNPNLMQLRMLQVMGSTTGNTYILGMPPTGTPLPVKINGHESKNKPADESAPE